ncbi:hypothetical protein [Streptomyces sp. NPDC097619]|uniref:hypothetical protein n=1 Tax=Streptomyces sp. NPDC097619 TaxID=3157228 RepID=UPI00331EBEDC
MTGRRPPLRAAGVLIGCATAPLGLGYFLLAGTVLGPLLLWRRTRPDALRALAGGARRLSALERARRSAFFGDAFPERYTASDRKVLRFLAVRCSTGLLSAAVLGLLGFGAVLAGLLVAGAARGSLDLPEFLIQVALGGVLLFLGVQGLLSLLSLRPDRP